MEGNNIEYLRWFCWRQGFKEVERMAISNEDEKNIVAIAGKPDVYDSLISSLAPHIYGHEIIKEAILLLIVGSIKKN